MMKARADDRRIFDSEMKPNILAFQDSKGMDAADITHALNSPINKEEIPPSEYLFEEIEEAETPLFSKKVLDEKSHVSQGDIEPLLELFENAKTFGSLMQVPPKLEAKLPVIEQRLKYVLKHGNLTHGPAHVIKPLLHQASLLARQYDCVVANPPFLDSKYHNTHVKLVIKKLFKSYNKNLFSCFLIRGLQLTINDGYLSYLTPFVWLFIDSYEQLRSFILNNTSLVSMVKPSYTAFFDMATVQFVAFSLRKCRNEMRGKYIDLGYLGSPDSQASRLKLAIQSQNDPSTHFCFPEEFKKLPGSPIAFWVGDFVRKAFDNPSLSQFAEVKIGMRTGDNERFLRRWYEVSQARIGIGYVNAVDARCSRKKWFPYNKGGNFRKWFGNNDFLVNWEDDGRDVKQATKESYPELGDELGWKISNEPYYFLPAVTWSKISSYSFGARVCDAGFLFDTGGCCLYPSDADFCVILSVLCSKLTPLFMQALNPSVNMQVGNVSMLPVPMDRISANRSEIDTLVRHAVAIARADWDSAETSSAFESSWFVTLPNRTTVSDTLSAWIATCNSAVSQMKNIEERINKLLLQSYRLEDHITPEVPVDHITLYRPDRETEIRTLLSYAIGCMMGRYSLDKSGLIYAHGGNVGFDPDQYQTFPADPDGIVPVTEAAWFADDATNRFVEFLGVAWPKKHLEENLKFVADSLGPNRDESPRDTIRRYLATGFYKHHLQTYKRRPIYWLFSSGKQRAFQCLVYLHRYHEGTLSRMRTEYVIPAPGHDRLPDRAPRWRHRRRHLHGAAQEARKGAGDPAQAAG